MDCRRARRCLTALASATLIAALGACASPTPYQPYRAESVSGVHGGYSDQRLTDNRFRVRFHGNEFTSRERVETYLLYRAAELTLANGYDWFTIADRHTQHDVETYVRHSPWGPGGYWQPHWRYYRSGYGWDVWHPEFGGPFWTDRIDVSTVESFEVEAEIVLDKGTVRPEDPKLFDARQVIADLGPQIELPKR